VKTQIPQFYNNKDLIYDEIWNLLSRGVVDRGEDFRLPTVILNDGKLSDGRVVVLRGAFKDINTIRFHTDYRSDKIRILKNNNNIYFVFYNKKRKIQVRVKGTAIINYKNDIALKAWEKTQIISRKCYLATNPPSKELEGKNPKIDSTEIGYNNFCVIDTKISEFEWLYLASQGHRRAKISLVSENKFTSEWVTP
jgi:3-hydroxyisobutyrate dehydrogenase